MSTTKNSQHESQQANDVGKKNIIPKKEKFLKFSPSSEEKNQSEQDDESCSMSSNETNSAPDSDDEINLNNLNTNPAELQALQRHRLLHLRHAIKCPYEENKCPISAHCGKLKVLWKHLLVCKDQHCKVPYCISSRFLLNHYRCCPKTSCRVCRPVRETYKRAHTEEEERELLLRVPPKRMRVSSSQGNFAIQGLKCNSFDEGREMRTRIVQDEKTSPFLGALSACGVSTNNVDSATLE